MIEVYDPCGIPRKNQASIAARPRTLTGLKFGILDNNKVNANVLLERTAELLRERGAELVVNARKEVWGLPAPGEVIDSLAHCETVIFAHGG
jgi:hypothetical protein